MPLRFGLFSFNGVAFVARLLLGLHALRRDEPTDEQHNDPLYEHDTGTDLTIDDCNAMLYTIMASTDLTSKQEVMLTIRSAMFSENGMDVLADFLTDGLYTIELNQARHAHGSPTNLNTLTLMKTKEEDSLYSGAFVIGGRTFGWLANADGYFYWHSGVPSRPKVHMGHEALSGSCFLIIGCAFIAQTLRPFSTENFYRDALAIVNSATLLTGHGHTKVHAEVAKLIMSNSIDLLRDKFDHTCPDILRLTIGDVLSAVGPPPKNPPPPEDESALLNRVQNNTIRLTIHGV